MIQHPTERRISATRRVLELAQTAYDTHCQGLTEAERITAAVAIAYLSNRTPRSLEEYLADATEIVGRSNMLWLAVNEYIRKTLVTAICKGRSREWVHDELLRVAGKRWKNEPTSIGNFRSAAKQIKQGKGKLVLI